MHLSEGVCLVHYHNVPSVAVHRANMARDNITVDCHSRPVALGGSCPRDAVPQLLRVNLQDVRGGNHEQYP